MSPLTGSFFTTWAFYNLRFDGTETLASCLIEAKDVNCMNPDQLAALIRWPTAARGSTSMSGWTCMRTIYQMTKVTCSHRQNEGEG